MKHTKPHTIKTSLSVFGVSLRLRSLTVVLMFSILCLGSLGTVSCRDVSRMCRKYVDKYKMCTAKRYKQAKKIQSQLSAQARKQSGILLRQLQQKLQSPKWHERHMRLCVKTPPTNQRFRCVYRTACSSLSRCNPQASNLAPQGSNPTTRQ